MDDAARELQLLGMVEQSENKDNELIIFARLKGKFRISERGGGGVRVTVLNYGAYMRDVFFSVY